MLDLSKAFDSIQHAALLNKLRVHGLTDEALSWFQELLGWQTTVSPYQQLAVNTDHYKSRGSIWLNTRAFTI